MRVLRARLYEMEMRKQQDAIAKDRRSQVGTGERSEKIRTYNFKENRITDHRVHFTIHRLTEVLNRRSHRPARQGLDALSDRKAEGSDNNVIMTIHELVQGARDRLMNAGISANLATLDAEVLARQVLGWDRARFLTDRNEKATSVFLLQLRAARRAARAAGAGVLHSRHARVLGAALRSRARRADSPARDRVHRRGNARARRQRTRIRVIVDVGTGSGCIAHRARARDSRRARHRHATCRHTRSTSRGATRCATTSAIASRSSKRASSTASRKGSTSSSRIPRTCRPCRSGG